MSILHKTTESKSGTIPCVNRMINTSSRGYEVLRVYRQEYALCIHLHMADVLVVLISHIIHIELYRRRKDFSYQHRC